MAETSLVERLVGELLARGDMREDTKEELERYRTEARDGTLHPDDLNYLKALHQRLQGSTVPEPESPSPELSADEWMQRAQAALQRAEEAEAALARIATSEGNEKYNEIKKRFAEMYGPSNEGPAGTEAMTRAEIFEAFWAEFEDVDKM